MRTVLSTPLGIQPIKLYLVNSFSLTISNTFTLLSSLKSQLTINYSTSPFSTVMLFILMIPLFNPFNSSMVYIISWYVCCKGLQITINDLTLLTIFFIALVFEDVGFNQISLEEELLITNKLVGKSIEKFAPRWVKLHEDVVLHLCLCKYFILLLPNIRVFLKDLLFCTLLSVNSLEAHPQMGIYLHFKDSSLQYLLIKAFAIKLKVMSFLLVVIIQGSLLFKKSLQVFLLDLCDLLYFFGFCTHFDELLLNRLLLLLCLEYQSVGLIHSLLLLLDKLAHILDLTLCFLLKHIQLSIHLQIILFQLYQFFSLSLSPKSSLLQSQQSFIQPLFAISSHYLIQRN